MKASVFIGTSVDGFIARTNGDLDFLPPGGGEPHGYDEFMATVDALVIGRKTFETVLTFDTWPYGEKPVFVLSTRPLAPSPIGAVVERMRFAPFLIFASLWSVLVYAVLAHWSFGGGWLQAHGTLDFAGGVPVEMGSGFSALAAALVVGARKDYGRQALLPHNAVYVLLGAGLLWFGWFGFNGGSGFATGHSSVLAFTNTLLCPACTLVVWFGLDLLRGRRVTAIGAATAIVVGCVGITPAGGYISPIWAMVLGAVAALPSYAIIVWRPRTRVDETLDVLAAHGTAGITGILFIGFFAQLSWNGASNGLFYGNASQLGWQAIAALAGPAYAFTATFVLLRLIGLLMPLRATEHQEALGMDIVQHGEEAYATGEGAILVSTEAGLDASVAVARP